MATNDTLAADSCAEFTQPEGLNPAPNLGDLPRLGVDDDDRHIGRMTRLVLDPEGNGPVAARRNAPAQEPDVVPLGGEIGLGARDLDCALLAHVVLAATGQAGEREPDDEQSDHERDAGPGDPAQALAEARPWRGAVGRRPRNGGQGIPGSGTGR